MIQDILQPRYDAHPALYCNNGDGTFDDCTIGSGLETIENFTTAAAFVDVDQDGDWVRFGRGAHQLFRLFFG